MSEGKEIFWLEWSENAEITYEWSRVGASAIPIIGKEGLLNGEEGTWEDEGEMAG